MERSDFCLSVEEVALAVSMAGQPEVAHGLMMAQLGTMPQEEVRARLRAAGHSLLARGWLAMDAQGEMHLADPLTRIARVLSRADFSIRYSRSHRNAELALTFHFGEEGIFAHRLEQGVVHHIVEVQDTDAVIQGGLEFYEVANVHPFNVSSVEVPQDVLDAAKDEGHAGPVLKKLKAAGVPEETRTLLAEDLVGVQYRGAILRVEYGEDNTPRSDRGLLVLRGPERLWLMRALVRDGKPAVILLAGTEEIFRREVAALL